MITLAAGNTLQGYCEFANTITYTVFGTELASGVSTSKVLAQGVFPGASFVVIYTVPTATTAFINHIVVSNVTTVMTRIIFYVNGQADANRIYQQMSVQGYGGGTFGRDGMKPYDTNGNYTTYFDINIGSNTAGYGVLVTTPLAVSVVGTATTMSPEQHAHQSSGGCNSLVSAVTISNASLDVFADAIPANLLRTGTAIRVIASGVGTTGSTPGNTTINLGLTKSLGSNTQLQLVLANTASISSQPFYLQALISIRTNGQTGSWIGQMIVQGTNVSTGLFSTLVASTNVVATTAIDTTTNTFLELSAVTGKNTSSIIFHTATWEIVKM